MPPARFRYALDALLRKNRSEWKTLKIEEAAAGGVVEQRNAEVGETRGSVEDLEQSLRDASRDGKPIDAARHHLLSRYLAHQRTVLTQRQQALARARDVYEQIRSNLAEIGRGIKSLEKHRAGRQVDHEAARSSAEQNQLDETYLLGVRNGADADNAAAGGGRFETSRGGNGHGG